MQMQAQLADTAEPSNILRKPEHILSFIQHALTSASSPQPPANQGAQRNAKDTLGMADLRIVPEKDDLLDNGDSDDETPPTSNVSTDDEMTDTAVNLLLAILEGTSTYRKKISLPSKPHDGHSERRTVGAHSTCSQRYLLFA